MHRIQFLQHLGFYDRCERFRPEWHCIGNVPGPRRCWGDVFFGAINSSSDIGWVALPSERVSGTPGVTGVAFGNAAVVPESPTLLLLLPAFLLSGFKNRAWRFCC